MRKINVLNLLAASFMSVAMLNLTSCTKVQEEVQNAKDTQNAVVMKNQATIEFDYQNSTNMLTGGNFEQELLWNSNGSNLGSIFLDYPNMDEITVLSNSGNVITFDMSGKTFMISTQSSSSEQITFTLVGPSERHVNFAISGGTEELNNYFNNFLPGQKITYGVYKSQIGWPVVFAAAAIIGGLVDAYCDHLIQVSVNECVAAGGKPHVGTCEVTCDCCYL